MAQRMQLSLSPDESDRLNQIVETGSAVQSRRARIILLTATGLPQIAIAAEVGLSERQVRRWQYAFQSGRMDIFLAPGSTGSASPRRAAAPAEALPTVLSGESPSAAPPPLGVEKPRRKLKLRKKTGIQPEDPMSEAGRKILHYHLERMLLYEPGSRRGEIEAVHDMRVATRRIRSAIRLFKPSYRGKTIRPISRGLRRIAHVLGVVRDLDVFMEKLEHYRAGLPPGADGSLTPLLETGQAQHEAARAHLIAHLDSPAFEEFVTDFAAFTTTAGLGARKVTTWPLVAYQVRHVAPRLLYTRYEAVRAYETVLDHASPQTLHALRIECKRLRYTLEFFSEVLGGEVNNVIEALTQLQDHLGELNDAQVAGNYLREFVSDYEKSQADLPIAQRHSIEQVVQYMAHQFAEKYRLTTTLAAAWERFTRDDVRRDLGLAVAVL